MRCALILGFVVGLVGRADATPADDSFERGRVLMQQGKIAEACAAFEQSLALDFQFGTLFNLAGCDVQRGKLATALAAYRRMASEDKNQQRADRSRELADQLAPRVPMLELTIPAQSSVTVDGIEVDATKPLPIDLGRHEVVVRPRGRPVLERTIEVTREGERVPVAYQDTQVLPPPPPPKKSRTGTIVIGAGALTFGTGLVLGALALRGWHDAEDTATMDPDQANRDLKGVRKLGNASTGLVIAGVLTAGVGFYLRW